MVPEWAKWVVILCALFLTGLSLVRVFISIRKRELAEIERFKPQANMDATVFLKDIGIEPSSREAEAALAVRSVIAELGEVPPESIKASHRFYPDLENLPFYDSPDFFGFVVALEDKFGIEISSEEADEVPFPHSQPDLTVGDMVWGVIRLVKKKQVE